MMLKASGARAWLSLKRPDSTATHLNINAGVGTVHLYLPENVAARLTVSGGIGGVNIPDYFQKVQKGDEFLTKGGIWETAGFAVAGKQVIVDFSGGVGHFGVHVGELPDEPEKPKEKPKRQGKVKVNINVDTDDDDTPEVNA
jgi:hypothetical protein